MSDSPHQFYIASGAMDVEFRKPPAIKHTDTVEIKRLATIGVSVESAGKLAITWASLKMDANIVLFDILTA